MPWTPHANGGHWFRCPALPDVPKTDPDYEQIKDEPCNCDRFYVRRFDDGLIYLVCYDCEEETALSEAVNTP